MARKSKNEKRRRSVEGVYRFGRDEDEEALSLGLAIENAPAEDVSGAALRENDMKICFSDVLAASISLSDPLMN